MKYAIINTNGKFIYTLNHLVGDLPDGNISVEVEDHVTNEDHYFNGVTVIPYTESQLLSKRTYPNHSAEWDDDLMSWVDQRSLPQIKESANLRVNRSRLEANLSGFNYLDKVFSTDALSRSDIDGIANYVSLNNALPVDWVGGWKSVDNTYLQITTVQEWKDFYAAMVSVGTANFVKAQTLKAQIDAATSIEEVEAIVW